MANELFTSYEDTQEREQILEGLLNYASRLVDTLSQDSYSNKREFIMSIVSGIVAEHTVKGVLHYTGFNGLAKFLGRLDMGFFAKYYMPEKFGAEFGTHHYKMFEELMSEPGTPEYSKRVMMLCFRGAGKSIVGNTLFSLHRLVYRNREFVLEVCASDDIAKQFVEAVKDVLESNELIIRDFNKQKTRIWSMSKIMLSNGNCMMGKGFTGKMRGIGSKNLRPTTIILDDAEDRDTGGTAEKAANTTAIMKEKVFNLGYPTTRIIHLATIVDSISYTYTAFNTPANGFKKVYYKLVDEWPTREDMWKEYCRLRDPLFGAPDGTVVKDSYKIDVSKCIYDAHQYYLANKEEMDKGAVVAWESAKPIEECYITRIEQGENSFQKEYQHDLSYSESKLFNKFLYYDPSTMPPLAELTILAYVDSAKGLTKTITTDKGIFESDNNITGGDYTAITVLGTHNVSGKVYFLYGDISKTTIPQTVLNIFDIGDNKFPSLYNFRIESNNATELMIEVANEFTRREHLAATDQAFNIKHPFDRRRWTAKQTTQNKHVRICAMKSPIESGLLLFPAGLSTPYFKQVQEYTSKASHDDAPDSLKGCLDLAVQFLPKQR